MALFAERCCTECQHVGAAIAAAAAAFRWYHLLLLPCGSRNLQHSLAAELAFVCAQLTLQMVLSATHCLYGPVLLVWVKDHDISCT